MSDLWPIVEMTKAAHAIIGQRHARSGGIIGDDVIAAGQPEGAEQFHVEFDLERHKGASAAELIDRFGKLPDEVSHLFEIVFIKQLAKAAGVEKIDAGPKGGTIAFRGNAFAQPLKLVQFIGAHSGTMKVRPDQKVVVTRDWPTPEQRQAGVKALLGQLAKMAA